MRIIRKIITYIHIRYLKKRFSMGDGFPNENLFSKYLIKYIILIKAMFFYSNAFRITAFIFILVTVLIILIKPALFFDNDGQLKSFGLTYSEQTTPLPFCAFIY